MGITVVHCVSLWFLFIFLVVCSYLILDGVFSAKTYWLLRVFFGCASSDDNGGDDGENYFFKIWKFLIDFEMFEVIWFD